MRVVARGWGSCALVRVRVVAWSVLGPRWWRARVGVCPLVRAVFLALLRGGVLRVVARALLRARVCACGCACGCVWGGRACVRGPPPGGVLWRFPTLPHPLGCSTIGAAGLSFQVRNVAGRFPGAVTTTRLCRPPCWPAVWCGGVGGGLVVVRIVVAASCPRVGPVGPLWACGRGGLSWCRCPPGSWLGGLVWCRPISTSRLASASRRFHLWPIDPLFWRGPLTPCGGVETSSRSGLPA